ncbi:MAG: hypothetical protein ACYC9N_13485 [Thermoanaerobaculia bacterium]
MTPLLALWLPIVIAAVLVFIASSVIHMFTPWHTPDHRKLPDEEAFRGAVGPLAIPPGDYMVPRCDSMTEMKSAAFKQKITEGPVVMMTVFRNGEMGMGRQLTLWFVYLVVVGIFAGYIAGRALPPGAHYLSVFRFAGATAFIGYSLALWQMSIWYQRALGTTIRSTIDGLIYALLTAGVFGWLWPR